MMRMWVCPRCGAVVAYGYTTLFGRYTEADAMLNHIEEHHPEWEVA